MAISASLFSPQIPYQPSLTDNQIIPYQAFFQKDTVFQRVELFPTGGCVRRRRRRRWCPWCPARAGSCSVIATVAGVLSLGLFFFFLFFFLCFFNAWGYWRKRFFFFFFNLDGMIGFLCFFFILYEKVEIFRAKVAFFFLCIGFYLHAWMWMALRIRLFFSLVFVFKFNYILCWHCCDSVVSCWADAYLINLM